jgi:hypothetical protein
MAPTDTSVDESSRPIGIEEMRRLTAGAGELLERLRAGETVALAELKLYWRQLRVSGASSGRPAVTVLGSALESLSEAWQRARVGGRDHPDAPRLTGEALELAAELLQGDVARGSGALKGVCQRAAELEKALGEPPPE